MGGGGGVAAGGLRDQPRVKSEMRKKTPSRRKQVRSARREDNQSDNQSEEDGWNHGKETLESG